MEFEILSSRGKVKISGGENEVIIPPYPKMIHPPQMFNEPMVAELKWNGYNVRTFGIGADIVSILRGGRPDDRTRDMILEHYGDKIRRFFEEHGNMVLCGEVIGKKTMAKYKAVEFDYLIFDIIELGEEPRFLGHEEKKKLIEEYGFNYVGDVGVFDSYGAVLKKLSELPGPEHGVEGVVLKALDGSYIFKLRYDMHPDMFRSKINEEWRRRERREEVIFAHFIQGYPEEELGLMRGISIDEFREIEREMESFYSVPPDELERRAQEVSERLYRMLESAGEFDDEMKARLRRVVNRYVAKELKKAKKHTGR
ncbi:MAG: hypothetical protein GXO25_07295 [Euryarchaeota archaeon]|nr:hypothetical protein [Euryarchaeota archaeon]